MNKTLNGSMKTPAFIPEEETHENDDPKGTEDPITSGTIESARIVVIKLTVTV